MTIYFTVRFGLLIDRFSPGMIWNKLQPSKGYHSSFWWKDLLVARSRGEAIAPRGQEGGEVAGGRKGGRKGGRRAGPTGKGGAEGGATGNLRWGCRSAAGR